MVHIIDGEIVPDDDPRVLRQRQGAGNAGTRPVPNAGPRGPIPQAGGGGGANGVGQNPLMMIAEKIGIANKFLTIPPFLGNPERNIPYIYLGVLVLIMIFFGLKAAVLVAIFYYVLTTPAPLQAPPPPEQERDVHRRNNIN